MSNNNASQFWTQNSTNSINKKLKEDLAKSNTNKRQTYNSVAPGGKKPLRVGGKSLQETSDARDRKGTPFSNAEMEPVISEHARGRSVDVNFEVDATNKRKQSPKKTNGLSPILEKHSLPVSNQQSKKIMEVHTVNMVKLEELLGNSHTNEEHEAFQIQKQILTQLKAQQKANAEIKEKNQIATQGDKQEEVKDVGNDQGGNNKKGYKGIAPLGSGGTDGVQNQYVELWINDTITMAEKGGMPYVLKRPEHKKPLHRYEIDSQTLISCGMKNDEIERLYRGLYTHSHGVLQMIKETTKRVKMLDKEFFQAKKQNAINNKDMDPEKAAQLLLEQKKSYLRGNIWRIYQILIEHCMPDEYEFVTKSMEKQSQIKIDEMHRNTQYLEKQFLDKDRELQERMHNIKADFAQMELLKVRFENERMTTRDELAKTTFKLEEEVKLRLYFEQKMNTLYYINNDLESKMYLVTQKMESVQYKYDKNEVEVKELRKQNEKLALFKEQAIYNMAQATNTAENLGNDTEKLKEIISKLDEELKQKNTSNIELTTNVQAKDSRIDQLEMKVKEIEGDLKMEKSYSRKIKECFEQEKATNKIKTDKLLQLGASTLLQKKEIDKLNMDQIAMKFEIGQQQETIKIQTKKIIESDLRKNIFQKEKIGYEDIVKIQASQLLEEATLRHSLTNQIIEIEIIKAELERKLKIQIQHCDELKKDRMHLEMIGKKYKLAELNLFSEYDDAKRDAFRQRKDKEEAEQQKEAYYLNHLAQEKTHRQIIIMQEEANETSQSKFLETKGQLEQMQLQIRNMQIDHLEQERKLEQRDNQLNMIKEELQMQKQRRIELVQEKSELNLEIQNLHDEIQMLHGKLENQKGDSQEEIDRLLLEIERQKGHSNQYQMGYEDNLTSRAILAEKHRTLTQEMVVAQAELRFLSKAYVSYLVYKGWTKKRQEVAKEEKFIRENLIKMQQTKIEQLDLQISKLEKNIENLEADIVYKTKNLVDYERKFGLYKIEKKELVDRLAAAQDEIEYLREKYVNLQRIPVETQYNYYQQPGILNNCVTQTTEDEEKRELDIIEYQRDPKNGEEYPREAGVVKNEGWVTEYYIKDKETQKMIECDVNGISIEIRKQELQRRLQRFRMFARLVGKLKASQNVGTNKRLERERLAQEEKERLEAAARETLKLLKEEKSLGTSVDLSQISEKKQKEEKNFFRLARGKLRKFRKSHQKDIEGDSIVDEESSDRSFRFSSTSGCKKQQMDSQNRSVTETVQLVPSMMQSTKSKKESSKEKMEKFDITKLDIVANMGSFSLPMIEEFIETYFDSYERIYNDHSVSQVEFRSLLKRINNNFNFRQVAELEIYDIDDGTFKAFNLKDQEELNFRKQQALNFIDQLKIAKDNRKMKLKVDSIFKSVMSTNMGSNQNESVQKPRSRSVSPESKQKMPKRQLKNFREFFSQKESQYQRSPPSRNPQYDSSPEENTIEDNEYTFANQKKPKVIINKKIDRNTNISTQSSLVIKGEAVNQSLNDSDCFMKFRLKDGRDTTSSNFYGQHIKFTKPHSLMHQSLQDFKTIQHGSLGMQTEKNKGFEPKWLERDKAKVQKEMKNIKKIYGNLKSVDAMAMEGQILPDVYQIPSIQHNVMKKQSNLQILKENIGHSRSVSEATLENGGDQNNKSNFKKRQIYLKRLSLNNGYEDINAQNNTEGYETVNTIMSTKIESRYRHPRISTQQNLIRNMNQRLNQNDYKDHDLINNSLNQNETAKDVYKPQFQIDNQKLANHYQIQIQAKEPTHEKTMSNQPSEGIVPGGYRLEAHFQNMDFADKQMHNKGANNMDKVFQAPTLVVNSRQYSQNKTAQKKNEVQIKSLLKTAFKS